MYNSLPILPPLADTGLLYEAQPTKSLLQVHKMLQASIGAALNKCSVSTFKCIVIRDAILPTFSGFFISPV